MRSHLRLTTALVLAISSFASPASSAPQNDAGSGSDAGGTFATATQVHPAGRYVGVTDPASGDRHDFYRFSLVEGQALSILVSATNALTDPPSLLDPDGVLVDAGVRVASLGLTHSGALTSEGPVVRLAVHRARVSGDYRLHLRAESLGYAYSLCFMNCEQPRTAPTDFIFGGSLRHTKTRVLLVPPSHGDLGDPTGPTVLDYIGATLRGIKTWTRAVDSFARDYPAYAYLRQIEVEVEIFDGVKAIDPVGYDVVIGYVAAGPAFRGIAAETHSFQGFLDSRGFGDRAHWSGRTIALSLFGASPRAGQVLYDFPELTDLEIVTVHEFGHTFGLGHTETWHSVLGPDLMNSPATFVYGNGFAVGKGTERTALACLSSLNLYGMARLYRWIPSGTWEPTFGSAPLPSGMPYKWYC